MHSSTCVGSMPARFTASRTTIAYTLAAFRTGDLTIPPQTITYRDTMPRRELSIACFRYVPRALRGDRSAEPYLNRLNERLMSELQLGGRVFPSNAVLDGRFALRACIVNFRTEAVDIDTLIAQTVEIGDALHRQGVA